MKVNTEDNQVLSTELNQLAWAVDLRQDNSLPLKVLSDWTITLNQIAISIGWGFKRAKVWEIRKYSLVGQWMHMLEMISPELKLDKHHEGICPQGAF